MKVENVMEAKAEAVRFLKRFDEWEEAQGKYYNKHCKCYFDSHTPSENGALKRSSLDLTRALAKMRTDTR